MTQAVELLKRAIQGPPRHEGDSILTSHGGITAEYVAWFHPNVIYNGFDATGTVRPCYGVPAIIELMMSAVAMIAEAHDEFIAFHAIDEDIAVAQVRGYRKFNFTGEEVTYDYAMMAQFENGLMVRGGDLVPLKGAACWRRAYMAKCMAS